MGKNRLEAFSDGVIAIIITIMVLNLKIPQGTDLHALNPNIPVFLSYILSFIYIGIYWNNHHHMLHTVEHVTGSILWANLHLLFWLSLFPFVTGWVGNHYLMSAPMALYGFVLFMAGNAYFTLQYIIIATQGRNSLLAKAIGRDFKGKLSGILNGAGVIVAFYAPWISVALYILVALIWLIPDQRIERVLN
ncbi:MAG TPA: TMEM175 family protein [Gammaproteobacteria bacterium]|nr:TMEM175 family protein [Gammaproteobacteria bacterium]